MFDEEAKDSRSASLHAAGSLSKGAGSGFGESYSLSNPSIRADEDIPQPTIFNGKLKGYQLKGMNWLANLYEQVHVSYFIFLLFFLTYAALFWNSRYSFSLFSLLWIGQFLMANSIKEIFISVLVKKIYESLV